jgi:hypothetical protein
MAASDDEPEEEDGPDRNKKGILRQEIPIASSFTPSIDELVEQSMLINEGSR